MMAAEKYYYESEDLTTETKKNKNLNNKKKHKRIVKNTSHVKILFLSFLIIPVIIALYLLSGYTNISSIRHEITKLEREKASLEKTKLNLIADLENIKKSTKIEEEAILKLGMNYPDESQIVYLSIGTENLLVEESSTFDIGLKRIK